MHYYAQLASLTTTTHLTMLSTRRIFDVMVRLGTGKLELNHELCFDLQQRCGRCCYPIHHYCYFAIRNFA